MRRAAWALAAAAVVAPAAPGWSQTFEPSMSGWFIGIQRSMSALRVDTRQDSLVAEQAASADTNAGMGLASVIVEQEAAIQMRRAVARYESMHTDLTTGLCTVADAQRSVGAAGAAAETVEAELRGFEERWIERGGDRSDTLIATHRLRRTVFCTQSEMERGLCEGPAAFGVPPAGDSDAAPFLLRRSYGSTEVDVGTVFVDTVAPFPTIQTADEAVSVAELVERAERRRELALVALARAGLTDVLVRGLEGGMVE
jgi:hypothetical protein